MPSPSQTKKQAEADGVRLPRRRPLIFVLTCGAFISAAAIVTSALHSEKSIRNAVEKRIETLSDFDVLVGGEARFALLPRPHLIVGDVHILDRAGAVKVDVDSVVGVLSPLGLATGSFDITSLRLHRPNFVIVVDKAIETAKRPKAFTDDQFPLGSASIIDGVVSTGGGAVAAERVNATIDWRRVGEPLAITGSFDRGGETIEAKFWVPRPGELFRDQNTSLSVRLDGMSFALQSQGLWRLGANARFAGHLNVTAASGRHALFMLDSAPAFLGPLAKTQFDADIVATTRQLEFSRLRLSADGNRIEGDASLRREDGRDLLSATLQSDFVTAKATVVDPPSFVGSDGQWSHEPFNATDLSGAELDVRLKAAHARLGQFVLDDASFVVTRRDSKLDIDLSDARAYRGALKWHTRFATEDKGLSVHVEADARNIDAALLSGAVGGRALAGSLDATASVDSFGSDMSALMRDVKGRGAATLVNGEIDGLDIERALRRMEQQPLASALEIRSGRTVLHEATLTAEIENGVADFRFGEARGPGVALQLFGQANLAERSLLLHAVARALGADGANPQAKDNRIAFDVVGGWDDLTLTTDTQTFIRHSGAAAPLLPSEPAPTEAPTGDGVERR